MEFVLTPAVPLSTYCDQTGRTVVGVMERLSKRANTYGVTSPAFLPPEMPEKRIEFGEHFAMHELLAEELKELITQNCGNHPGHTACSLTEELLHSILEILDRYYVTEEADGFKRDFRWVLSQAMVWFAGWYIKLDDDSYTAPRRSDSPSIAIGAPNIGMSDTHTGIPE